MKTSKIQKCIIELFDSWTKCNYYERKDKTPTGYCKHYIEDRNFGSNGGCLLLVDKLEKEVKERGLLDDELFSM